MTGVQTCALPIYTGDTYELVYHTGGHGGPYKGLEAARRGAERMMQGGSDRWIAIVKSADITHLRDARAVDLLSRSGGWQGSHAMQHWLPSQVRRNPRRLFSPVPGLSEWKTYAGGTAAREGTHSYDYKQPDWVTEFHISPSQRHGYNLQTFALPGHGGWSHHGSFKTPHMAAAYARRLASRTGVQERA